MNTDVMKHGIRYLAISAMMLIAGCAGPGVQELSPNTYTSAAQYGIPFGGWDRARVDALAQAKETCSSRGKNYQFIREDRTGAPGFTPLRVTITFTCDSGVSELVQAANLECKEELESRELDPIRSKVELHRDSWESPVPFAIATIDVFPSDTEKAAIAYWASLRENCVKRVNSAFSIPKSATPLQITQIQEDRSFAQTAAAKVGDLIVALYQQKLTYGEFAGKRYEIGRDAAEAERQYRQSLQIADRQQQLQAQQLAQQAFANRLAIWSTYMQSVNARQPQTVLVDGTIRVQH